MRKRPQHCRKQILTERGLYDTGTGTELPPKIPGRHRWVVVCGYTITEPTVTAMASGQPVSTFLDHENRFSIAMGCLDCEQQWPDILPGSYCPDGPEREAR